MKVILLLLVLSFAVQHGCFSQVSPQNVGTNLNDSVGTSYSRADTLAAVRNLFQRKRKGGQTRAIVFGILGTASLIGALTYEPETVNINQGSAGTQKVVVSSSPDPATYIFIAFSAVMTITGITQHKHYSPARLGQLMEEFGQSGQLPEKIKSKLKKKDFEY